MARFVPCLPPPLQNNHLLDTFEKKCLLQPNWKKRIIRITSSIVLSVDLTLCRADDPLIPLHLLVFAVQTGVTTLTCVADMMSWTAVTRGEKWALGALYGPYLALGESFCVLDRAREGLGFGVGSYADFGWGWKAVFMGVDCFGRVRGRLGRV